MNSSEKKVIKKAREEMDDNPVAVASFKIQSILEGVFQEGISVGETIGYAKAIMEHADMSSLNKNVKKTDMKTSKGCKK
jgi:hypothetical protein